MTGYSLDSTVVVAPFVRRHEGNEVVIGAPERGVFLALPPEAVDILDTLAAGETVGEAVRRYESRTGQTPDIDDFLNTLAAEGFVRRADERAGPPEREDPHRHGRRRVRRISLDWISPTVARRLISAPALVTYAVIVAIGAALVLADRSIVPGPTVYLFPNGPFFVLALTTIVLGLAGALVHELAHATVARAVGAHARLGIGNLMYIVVAQTDISGMRLAPKRQILLAVCAGTIADLVTASLLAGVLFINRHGLLGLSPPMVDLVGAVFFSYMLRIFSQSFFYLRTDLYFLISAGFNCRDLMSDTERLLRNGLLRLVGKRPRPFDLSRLARTERLVIRAYAAFYLVGRAFAIFLVFYVVLPILWAVTAQFVTWRSGQPSHLGFLDFLLVGVTAIATYGGGLWMWLRDLYGYIRPSKRADAPVEPERTEPAATTS